MASHVKEEKNGQYGQMENNNNELENWTKYTTKKCACTWSCPFSDYFPAQLPVVKGSTCMQSVLNIVALSALSYSSKLSFSVKGFHSLKKQQTLEQIQLDHKLCNPNDCSDKLITETSDTNINCPSIICYKALNNIG